MKTKFSIEDILSGSIPDELLETPSRNDPVGETGEPGITTALKGDLTQQLTG